MSGMNRTWCGVFSARSLRWIRALALQEPSALRVVPNVNYVTHDTVNALVDFHEGKYDFPGSLDGCRRLGGRLICLLCCRYFESAFNTSPEQNGLCQKVPTG